MRYCPLALGASIAFAAVAIMFDHHQVDQLRAEIDQLRIDRNSLLILNADLQDRVDAQLKLDRHEEDRLKHADEISDHALHGGEFYDSGDPFSDIEVETLRWEDAGRPNGMYWGEFYAKEQLRRQGK